MRRDTIARRLRGMPPAEDATTTQSIVVDLTTHRWFWRDHVVLVTTIIRTA